MVYHVYSTLANSQRYVKYAPKMPGGLNIPEREIFINGGAGIAQKRTFGTPLGVYTRVPDEEMEWLKDHPCFKDHMAKGYIRMEKRKMDPEAVAADMATRQWVKGAGGHPVRGDAFPVVPQEFNAKPVKDGLTAIVPKTNKAA
jgi:hypothetical protein